MRKRERERERKRERERERERSIHTAGYEGIFYRMLTTFPLPYP